MGQSPSGEDAFDIYWTAYFTRQSMVDQHPCVQAAVADVHEGLDGGKPHNYAGISPSRFTRAYEHRVAVWVSNPAGREEIERRWPQEAHLGLDA
jgi:hypothetical protein